MYESDLIEVPGGSSDTYPVQSTIDDPIEFTHGELIYVSTSRIGADNAARRRIHRPRLTATSTFSALDTLGISFVGWVRDIEMIGGLTGKKNSIQ